ncbi:glycosyltransferase [Metabacillus sp. HB246100]
MKVLIISHLYPSKNKPSYGVFVHEQVKELKKQGCDVTVVAPVKYVPFPLNYRTKWQEIAGIPKVETYEGITVFHPRFPSLPKNILFDQIGQFLYLSIINLVTQLNNEKKFDLIHAHVALPNGYASYKISEKLECPFIVTIHGQDLQKTIYYNEKCRKNVELTISKASKIILVSTKLQRLLMDARFRGNLNYEIIPNGVDYSKINPTKPNVKYFQNEGPKLLSVSNLYPEKSIDTNLYAISKLIKNYPNLEYNIVGDGPEKQRLKELAGKLGIKDNVRFLGAFIHEDVLSIMNQCDVFSMPSINEAFGVVYIEAMSLGKPVIGCHGEGPEDIVDDKRNGFLIKKNDVEQLTSALDLLFKDKELREKIGVLAKETVKNRFTWENVSKDIIKEYNYVLDKSADK